jgi:nitroreductase
LELGFKDERMRNRDAGHAMGFTSSMAELIRQRRSCRKYRAEPIAEEKQQALEAFLASNRSGPFGSRARFALVAATAEDHAALKGLGTYGFIDKAAGFIIGAVERGSKDLEDYGWLMERAVLLATDLGLGTCWLGGTFTKSGFGRKIGLAEGELMPAVAAVGYAVEEGFAKDRIRRMAGANFRRPPEALFFNGAFGAPLSPAAAGAYSAALELVRWAPSASNRQPWRIVRTPSGWHFFLERTKGYGKGTLTFVLLRLADLQRVDLGIAMCHFELAAREAGLAGAWVVEDPGIAVPAGAEYTATWRPTFARGSAEAVAPERTPHGITPRR